LECGDLSPLSYKSACRFSGAQQVEPYKSCDKSQHSKKDLILETARAIDVFFKLFLRIHEMLKTAETKFPILDVIAKRWSPVAFAKRPVEKEKLQSIFEAGRWAPSSFNEQPWHFIIATKDDPQEFEKVLSCFVEGNSEWAQYAPVLILSVTRLQFSRNGKPNRHAFHDIGLIAENMVLQATALGLMMHQMAGIKPDKVRDIFGLPEGYEAVTGIAIGYEGDASHLSPELQERQVSPRTRKPLEEFIFSGRWGKTSKAIAD
jgi:nitroreductase